MIELLERRKCVSFVPASGLAWHMVGTQHMFVKWHCTPLQRGAIVKGMVQAPIQYTVSNFSH